MPDHQIVHTSQAFSPGEWMRENARDVLKAMYPDGGADPDLRVMPYVSTYERLVLKVRSGSRTVILKAFSTEHKAAMVALHREAAVLTKLNGTSLCPELIHFSAAGKWIMLDFVDGPILEEVITEDTVIAQARSLGDWYRRYTDCLDTYAIEESSTWLDYLQGYDVIQKVAIKPEQETFLARLPIQRRLVAKNDAYLGNFLLGPNETPLGIDFEKSRMKPYGFDILVTGRMLVSMFPHMLPQMTDALVDGFGRGTDTMSQDDLLQLTRLFAASTAFTLQNKRKSANERRLRSYNASAAVPAARIVETPIMSDALIDQDPVERDRLAAFLREAAKDGTDSGDDEKTVDVKYDETHKALQPPDPREDAFCETCRGSCCSLGASKMAFLRKDTLQRTQQALNLGTLSDAIDYYLDLVPKRHVAGSCFFHTETGCAIPRERRSVTCNTYQCVALRRLRSAMKQVDPETPILIFNGEADKVQRARVICKTSVEDVDPQRLR